jgi:phosphoribosylaminoimidazole-succinocarboxamide synthase
MKIKTPDLSPWLPLRLSGSEDLPTPNYRGKVRDSYDLGDTICLLHTDRVSAFDRAIGLLPAKGELLARLSAWWFRELPEATPHHLIDQPDPNLLICRKLKMIPVEMVVRGYLTGSTNTSIWKRYQDGERDFGGITLPDGMSKNDPLPLPIITPTTKESKGDRNLEPDQLIAEGWITAELWDVLARRSLEIFQAGQRVAEKAGLILVDTKYEFGLDPDGNVYLADELHTPDSSRFWRQLKPGKIDQTSFDKESLRLWLRERCDPYQSDLIPALPEDLCLEVAGKYAYLFHALTGKAFAPAPFPPTPAERIRECLETLLSPPSPQP